jgi:cystathionine beta-lyase
MEKIYDFDRVIDRRGTGSVMYDRCQEMFGREDILPLWVADMGFATCPDITQALAHRVIDHPIYGYSVPLDDYWQSIIDWQRERNGLEFTTDEACFIGGIVNGFGLVVNHFTRPGDAVVIQEPVYHPFRNVLMGNNRKVVVNDLKRTGDGFYEMDLEGLERIFEREHPVMMVLCNPHNPIGIAWEADVQRQVAALAKKYGVIVFSDEIHGDLVLRGHRHTSFLTVSDDARAVGIVMGAPSKTFNIAGIVSSWCVIKNPELRKPFFHRLETNEQCSPNFLSMTATRAAYRHGGPWLAQCLDYIEGNIDMVVDYCRDHIPSIVAIRPQASFLVWLDCTGLGWEHDALIDLFVNKARIGLNDGAMFGRGGSGFMRLNVAVPRSLLHQGMQQLAEAVASLG